MVISAQQQWLPNLATEMGDQKQSAWSTAITVTGSPSPEEPSASDAESGSGQPEAEVSEAASTAKLDPPVCTVRILGQCLLSKGREDEAEAAKAKATEPEGAAATTDTANAKADGDEQAVAADEQPRPAEPEGAAATTDTANAKIDAEEEAVAVIEQPQTKAADQTDDLLSPTADELRAIKAAEKAAQPGRTPAGGLRYEVAEPQTGLRP